MTLQIRELSPEELAELAAENRRLNPWMPMRPDIKESLDLYASRGILPGGFLTFVLENNLMGAMGHADGYNRATLWNICDYIWTHMPSDSHGSSERVYEWVRRFRGDS